MIKRKPFRNKLINCSYCSILINDDSFDAYFRIWIKNEWSTSTGKSIKPVSFKPESIK